MYPLISGIILGYEIPHNSGRILALVVVYVQGVALTYTLLGLVVAAARLQFQAALCNTLTCRSRPIGVVFYSSVIHIRVVFVATTLCAANPAGKLGQHPAWWLVDRCVPNGRARAGLICSPCTTAPLSAILLYIAQSGNMWAGGGTLYLYALRMGVPLVIVTPIR